MSSMRKIFNDFTKLEQAPDGSVRIPLGAEQVSPELVGLADGERVRLVYPGELVADATVLHQARDGYTLWYALLTSMDEIHDIHPETLADQQKSESGASSAPRG